MDADPTDRFAVLVAAAPASLPLDEALLLIAAHAHPELDLAAQRKRLDEMAAGVAEPDVDGVCAHLFGTLGFSGDTDTYYDPRNSLLPDVLDRRGACRSRSQWWRWRSAGAGASRSTASACLDTSSCEHPVSAIASSIPSTAAAGWGVAECREVYERLRTGRPWDDAYLDPVPPIAIVGRVLANLVAAHRRAGDRLGLCWSLRLRLLLPDATPQERRELGVLLGSAGRFTEGASVLEASDAAADLDAAARLRARLN